MKFGPGSDFFNPLVSPFGCITSHWYLWCCSMIMWSIRRRTMPLGPLGLPWICNRHQMPTVKPWRMFAKWNEQYSPVMSIFLRRTPVIGDYSPVLA
ncbi:uncharacterized protein BJ212DRAFT_1345370 [Suillus subaureus]|uniref:Uncharacterized protein n=1 Tax=Suillus subaureus TaxID=48587 RepID=A0A9P7JFK7_9AGAM|nr:uncharacterized protein BJ212DRAFT_1345370 [Suillus subaureus]KAG1819304.1 hypothetical protein BJ212DRAFT_1345370 [Suillus subaureus]